MKKTLLLSLLAASSLMASSLIVTNGSVKAHTEVFGDSTIDPVTKSITSHLSMGNSVESIKGSVDVSVRKLKSDNETRDEHMVEAIASDKYPLATYTFKSVTKTGNQYKIDGILNFHGVQKPLSIKADIAEKPGSVALKGKASFKMSDYGVKPPKLLLLTVRDRIDLSVNVTFKKK
ncbi:YceI family protein [Sulfurovum sp. NBC37-1]|uniref:YceI family protein n=1 Tax=Sulfurovum sp. (strain NBC37-1) TaxID=387093 RepID=UPI00015878D2|nr:YceI family protein [Sulfurovum sp. NBC37-1]BAF72027.1 conserved hypothetical protein [Sulfurovum sp. NBC37-1]